MFFLLHFLWTKHHRKFCVYAINYSPVIECSRTALLDGQKILNSGVNFTAKTSLILDQFNKVNYKSWKRIMQSFYQGLILLLSLFQRGLAGQFSVNQENSCSSDRCSSEDRGPCLDDGEKKLYRWDPVKVCQLFNESKHKWRLYLKIIAIYSKDETTTVVVSHRFQH